jgi:hypothetical protein
MARACALFPNCKGSSGATDVPACAGWTGEDARRSIVKAQVVALVLLVLSSVAHAGGPRYVAGASVFNPEVKGTPVTWAQGAVSYYTDQGNLSAQIPGPTADAMVAAAFGNWTSISTVAISATHGGQLAEDVTGATLAANNGWPPDVLPSAVNQPVAIVYDADGSITDALLGTGASDAALCSSNSVLGGPDNLGADAHFLHALIILNGNCAQLPDFKYHLVRMFGQVLGLDWSQVNVNMLTRNPPPTSADAGGFPVMHAVDPPNCVPVTLCYGASVDPVQPKTDDQAALSRLYPVTALNQISFPGKQVSSTNTVRISGSVYFVDGSGQAGQPMQGVNVVARWIDPVSNTASRTYAAASVSGFRFRGNAGNLVTGLEDASSQPYDRFGSDDPSLEGFFDLGALPVPNGGNKAEFELSVEPVDPLWSVGLQPYGTWQVQPSGANRVFVFANLGQDIQQNILMSGSTPYRANWFGPTSFSSPVPVPSAGDWSGALSPYGDSDYFWFAGQANRTGSVAVTALDDFGLPAANKAQPVVGLWPLSATQGDSPAFSTPAFDTIIPGETRLDFSLSQAASYRVAISDFRGDGRPDFRYRAHVFYGNSVFPARVSVAGGSAVAIRGLGFRQGDSITMGGTNLPVLALSAGQLLVAVPPALDGVQSIALSDPATGSSSVMSAVLTYGAGPSDTIRLVSGAGQQAPVGGALPAPIVVQVLTPDGVTPVAGASVFFTSSPAAALAACHGASSCTVLTSQSGQASTFATMLTPSAITVTAALAPASYNPPQQVQAAETGTSSTLDIALSPQNAWIAQGATLSIPLSAGVLANGTPLPGRLVDFQVLKGSALLTLASAMTDSNGYAASALQVSALAQGVLVSACVQPGNNPCLNFSATAVPASAFMLQSVAGNLQTVPTGQSFQPVQVQVTDSAVPAHPVLGASVVFQSLVARPPQNLPTVWIGDTGIGSNPMPVILASSQVTVQSDNNGLAAIQPSIGGIQGPVIVLGSAAAGTRTLQFALQSLTPLVGSAAAISAAPRSNLREDRGAR